METGPERKVDGGEEWVLVVVETGTDWRLGPAPGLEGVEESTDFAAMVALRRPADGDFGTRTNAGAPNERGS